MENKKRCTLKDRKAAARIISARAGAYDRMTPEALAAVGNMSDAEVLAFLDQELTPEKLDGATVEEIKPGKKTLPTDPEELADVVGGLVDAYMLKNNWEAEKISPMQWASCCLMVGRFFSARSAFRGAEINPDTRKGIREINAAAGVDVDALAAVVPLWLDLCLKYNKTPLLSDFMYFSGVSVQWLYSVQEVNPKRVELKKKLEQIQADGLRKRTLDTKASPVGAIFLLKADHGLVEATKTIHEYEKPAGSAAALPVFAETAPGIPEKPENSGF